MWEKIIWFIKLFPVFIKFGEEGKEAWNEWDDVKPAFHLALVDSQAMLNKIKNGNATEEELKGFVQSTADVLIQIQEAVKETQDVVELGKEVKKVFK